MKVFSLFVLSFLLFSCLKENLDKDELKRVVLLQIDAKTYKFEGGKEFAYFDEDTSTVDLPVSITSASSSPGVEGFLTLKYLADTIFDGTMQYGGFSGQRRYPFEIDNQIHYLRLDNNIAMPIESRFQTLYYDLGTEEIHYDSIWTAVRKLYIVNSYLNTNIKAKIGLFLYRPSEGVVSNPGNWKWYIVMKS